MPLKIQILLDVKRCQVYILVTIRPDVSKHALNGYGRCQETIEQLRKATTSWLVAFLVGKKMSRIAIFIDGGYVDKVLEHEFNSARIDYAKLPRHIADHISPDIDLLRAYYYHCLPYQSNPPTPIERDFFARKQRFFATLDQLPRFEVRYGRLERRGPDANGQYRYEQKLIDVLLSVDLVRLSATRQITHAAIVAGDSDFCPAVEVAKRDGVSVWLFHGRSPHRELWRLADERIQIDSRFINAIAFPK